MNILDQIVRDTLPRVAAEKERQPIEALRGLAKPLAEPFRFEKALAEPGMAFICECKKASPSKGLIAPAFDYLGIARDYAAAGAAAISVLTEPFYFQGADRYLSEIAAAVEPPVLRKDFLVDAYQIVQARAIGAQAVLLICAIITPQQLREYMELAHSLGMSCLVEAHDEQELHMAVEAGARVIGVNNRDLRTFKVDFDNSLRLRELAPRDTLFVAESGISTAADVALLQAHGIDAVLVGETLMRAPDKQAALDALRG